MNLYDATIPVFLKMLGNVERWLDKGVAHATAKKFDPELYLHERVAPDQYNFTRHVTAACDQMKFTAAKMTGKTPPSNPDTETTLAELRARIRTTAQYLETFTRADFEGCENNACSHTWMQGQQMRAGDYLDHFALPNLYFHLTTVYQLLRHRGVELGKTDYIGSLPWKA
jgi:hypothetical protein